MSVPRRLALATGAAGAATAAVLGPAGRASAADTYAPGSYAKTTVLPPAERHLASRFSYGLTPALRDEVTAAGGARAWFEAQLTAPYDATEALAPDWWPDLHLDANTLWQRDKTRVRGGWEVMADYGRRTLLRRITSAAQVREVMTEFWENLLHVPTGADGVFTHRTDYGDTLRRLALTSYDQLLRATVTHPAMTIFLSGYASTKAHPNENLGRELLELYTVGAGSYTEDEVKASARILTGFHIDMWTTFQSSYRSGDHWTGPVKVLGFEHANADPDGRPVVEAYLSYLARHPRTAHRLARRLAVAFVDDDPPAALVERLASVYLASDTAIVPVLRALVDSDEFAAAAASPTKLRTPAEDLVAAYRLLGVRIAKPTTSSSAANAVLWQASSVGQEPFTWPRPDGAPLTASAWASPSRVLASMTVHYDLAGGWWPNTDVTYTPRSAWLPETMPFRDLVDHLSRLLLHRPSDATLLRAACLALPIDKDWKGNPVPTTPTTTIAAGSAVVGWKLPYLLATFLDHPSWYTR